MPGLLNLAPAMRHVLAQHFIDARLPAASLLPECLRHIRVEPQRLVDLPVSLFRSATAATHQLLRRLFADKSRQYFRRWPRPGEIVLRPFGVVVVGAGAPGHQVSFLPYRLTSRLFAFRKLMTCKSSPRGVTTAACKRPSRRATTS